MGVTVDISNGVPMENGQRVRLTANMDFTWVNNTGNNVTLNSCGGFCTSSSYGPISGNGGTCAATVGSNPTDWSFSEDPTNAWSPGRGGPTLPHIQNPSKLAAA